MNVIKEIKFAVYGEPQGKGRPRFYSKNGRTFAYTPKDTVDYENCIRNYAGMIHQKFNHGIPLEVTIDAHYKIHKSVSKKVKQEMLEHKTLPTKKPDCDNVIKVVLDALNGVLYDDDAQVCNVNFKKFYSAEPRLEILIRSLGPEPEKKEEPAEMEGIDTKHFGRMLKKAAERWRAERGILNETL